MDYQKHYDRLIETRKNRVSQIGEYYENHHIVMKSMGGTNDSSNLIKLTAREHFLAHWLLWRIHENRQTAYAFSSFVNLFTGKNHEKRPKITSSRGYAEAREAYSKMHSERMTGELNSNRSKIVIQMDIEGNFMKEWPSAAEVKRELGICHVTSCCRGERPVAGNFLWKYKNPNLKKSRPYKKRESTKRCDSNYTRSKIQIEGLKERRWYHDSNDKNYHLNDHRLKIKVNQGFDLKPGMIKKKKINLAD